MLFDSSLKQELNRSFGATLVVLVTVVMTMVLIRTLGLASNGTGCLVQGEECCTVREDENFVHAWSLDLLQPGSGSGSGSGSSAPPPLDSLLTADAGELGRLLALGWQQVCVPTIFGRGPTATCVDGSLPTAGAAGVDAASRGPFVLLANSSSTKPLQKAQRLKRQMCGACTGASSPRKRTANAVSQLTKAAK